MLQNMVRHPNAGAVLVIGLGCENNQVAAFRETLGDIDPERVHFMIWNSSSDIHDNVLTGVSIKHIIAPSKHAYMNNKPRWVFAFMQA